MDWLKSNIIGMLVLLGTGLAAYSSITNDVSVLKVEMDRLKTLESRSSKEHMALRDAGNEISQRVTRVEGVNENLVKEISNLATATKSLNDSTSKLAITVSKLEGKVNSSPRI